MKTELQDRCEHYENFSQGLSSALATAENEIHQLKKERRELKGEVKRLELQALADRVTIETLSRG